MQHGHLSGEVSAAVAKYGNLPMQPTVNELEPLKAETPQALLFVLLQRRSSHCCCPPSGGLTPELPRLWPDVLSQSEDLSDDDLEASHTALCLALHTVHSLSPP